MRTPRRFSETLNARGAQLTAADLIKNFVFQRLNEADADVQRVYEAHWQEFETGFWETEVTTGRLRYPRSSVFLNHWLISETGEEIVAKDVFVRFKRFADFDTTLPVSTIVARVHESSAVYRRFIEDASRPSGHIDRVALFGYRTGVMESEVIKPLVLWLLDPHLPSIPPEQLGKALAAMESWLVRRMLVRATTKSYTRFLADLVGQLRGADRAIAGDAIEAALRAQRSESSHWPDDREVRESLRVLPVYRRLSRGRLRMVLEALEDDLRGWRDGQEGLGGERVERGKRAIEHIMPRKWHTHWPLDVGTLPDDRERLIHTLGNLTLLTLKLNSRVSNGPWEGADGKREGLRQHDVLMLNRRLLDSARTGWADAAIQQRTEQSVEQLLRIWPTPAGHQVNVNLQRAHHIRRVRLADLIAAGKLTSGQRLYPKRLADRARVCTLLPDGQIDVEGTVHPTPGHASRSILGRSAHGWRFFLVSPDSKRSLWHVYKEYIATLDVDSGDDDGEDEDDGE